MATHAPIATKTQRELLDEGTYPARIYEYIHLGTQKGEYEGKETNYYKIRFTFEFPTEKREFKEGVPEQPMVMSFDATLSLNEKANLRKMAEACFGKMTDAEAVNFDVDSLVGKECLVAVAHKPPKEGIVYAYITGFMPLIKGLTVEPQINATKILNFENWNEEVFQALPQFVKDKIVSSPEYKAKDKLELPVVQVGGYSEPITGKDVAVMGNGEVNVDDIPF